jgi:hypothetical protein
MDLLEKVTEDKGSLFMAMEEGDLEEMGLEDNSPAPSAKPRRQPKKPPTSAATSASTPKRPKP